MGLDYQYSIVIFVVENWYLAVQNHIQEKVKNYYNFTVNVYFVIIYAYLQCTCYADLFDILQAMVWKKKFFSVQGCHSMTKVSLFVAGVMKQ